ncbi:MAG: hypothetical protein UT86_C0002G0095 [Candidatus Magasanikbacteria bacterium GW2011_GWC2_40_17]|uniref:Uncharacterized protein n=1 Tax=Candidatus Magasanikbacteria bacterium GW2011_GWA2_42_32 TaxID=1619039 RepID=A0A0G1CFA4_9BACT|nr:MAG: hypothetical protein UT86_C0002G0095 [Candidatus Magasanikbacteria bacterium GW2011_GWC2_40_17]KKS57256.1 MAG: hypothetical protein UV20_C0002G0045 [Candidatus Magasanikbacteria bacterium GW2011_GWA2_42_32]OGH86146.1 MAG: hypothetical protein A2294_02730 [Candidatus Magasanikbacteria bacterium RIFOXYB2_FULL_38_10]
MYSIKNIFSLSYWFSQTPLLGSAAFWVMLIIFGLFLLAAIILKVLSQSPHYDVFARRGLKKISRLLGWMGVWGLIIVFFRYEFTPILSRRFMLGLWIIGLVVWLVFIVKYFLKIVPKRMAEKLEKERLNKYLP